MLQRISSCLVHPKFIGRYIIDKTWKIVVMLLVFCLINVSTIFAISFTNNELSNTEREQITSHIIKNEDVDLNFDGTTLSGNSLNLSIASGVKIAFLSGVDFDANYPVSVIFEESSYSTYIYELRVKTINYADADISPFNIKNDTQVSVKDKIALEGLINHSFKTIIPIFSFSTAFAMCVDMGMSFLMIMLFIFLLGMPINPGVRGIFRFRLILHTMVSYLTLYWFYLVFNNAFLYYVAMAIPYIYFLISIRNIVKIETKAR